jgi:NADH:ubiquinone oxidoreductase subunit F (NADH-binding)/(2Fe-2S) ferredoxin
VLLCNAAPCTIKGSGAILRALNDEIERRGLIGEVKIVETGCLGNSENGPVMVLYPDAVTYCKVSEADIPEIVEEHLMGGRPVSRLIHEEVSSGLVTAVRPAHKKEMRIALRNVGIIDPASINEYISHGGYDGAAKALTQMRPDEVIGLVKDSGLRGRSGGDPTGLKWESIADIDRSNKAVICTADDGEPGSFKDRTIVEGDPHGIIEGMLIAGYAIGASKGILYLRNEYRHSGTQIEWALECAREMGFLGENIMDSGFSFDIELFRGPNAHIGSEDSALIESIEGGRGEPRSTDLKLGDRPALVNNVETLANISQIVMNGADWLCNIGTAKSKGTKILSVCGDVMYPGAYEVPFGTSMREVIYDMAGGIKGGKRLKAVLVGGPSGTCVSEESLDRAFAFEDLASGGGALIVMDDSRCILDMARNAAEYFVRESCGQCTPCREGTKRILEMMKWWSTGAGSAGDLNLVQRLGETMALAAKCEFGQGATNAFRSSLSIFEAEYKAHIINKTCPAGVCAMDVSEECESCR